MALKQSVPKMSDVRTTTCADLERLSSLVDTLPDISHGEVLRTPAVDLS